MTVEEWKDKIKGWETTSSKTFLLFPVLEKIISNPKNKKILDVGCGDGFGVRFFKEREAKAIGVDISEDSIKTCLEKDPEGKYLVRDVLNDLDIEGDNDYVLSLLVLLSFGKKEKIVKALKNMLDKLKKDGRLIISTEHPAFDNRNDNMDTMTRSSESEYSYAKSGSKVIYKHKTKDMSFVDFHWTIEDYSKCIFEAGLVIEKILEPKPILESKEINPELYTARVNFPPQIVFICKKK